ncbi:MAG: hypothetical protein ACLGH8_17825 [Bacteroidia bacterium]
MKTFFIRCSLAVVLVISGYAHAQKNKECKYAIEDTTKGEELRTTPEYLMYERSFGGSSQFIFFSLSNSQGVPLVNFQLLSKAKDFPKMYCLDKDSRIYVQLANNRIVTLVYGGEGQCSMLIYDDKEKNNIRALTGPFLFMKGSMEDLESSAITFIRVKYSGEIVDYPIRTELTSETMQQTFTPERYFIENLKCVK